MENLVETLEELGGEFVKPMVFFEMRGQIWKFSSYERAEEVLEILGKDTAKEWNFIAWQNHYPENECAQIFVRM